MKGEDQAAKQAVLNVCQLMVDCLVENVLSLDESSGEYSLNLLLKPTHGIVIDMYGILNKAVVILVLPGAIPPNSVCGLETSNIVSDLFSVAEILLSFKKVPRFHLVYSLSFKVSKISATLNKSLYWMSPDHMIY